MAIQFNSVARRKGNLLSFLLLVADVTLIWGMYSFLLTLRYADQYAAHFNSAALCVMLFTSLFTVYLLDGYKTSRDPSDVRYYSEYLLAGVINFLGALFIIYFVTETPAVRSIVGSTLIIFPFVSVMYRRWAYKHGVRRKGQRILFIIGVNQPAQSFYHLLRQRHWPHEPYFYDPTGKRADQTLIENDCDSPVIRSDIWRGITEHQREIEAVVLAVTPQELPGSLVEWLVSRHYLELHVQTLENFYTTNWKIEPLDRISPYWAFEDGFLLNQSYSFERAKRVFDILISIIFGIITLPIWLIAMVCIVLDSKGPIFFRQDRVGIGQKMFKIYKFRSMKIDADKGDAYTRQGDPRVTRVGHFLRKTRIDELPQIINVLKGEMSIIGPRPEWSKLVDRYQRSIPYYHFRHLVKPGITGWAQVNYPYGESEQDAIEKLKYDLYYVRYYSFLLDLTICFKTAYVMFFGKGR